MKSLTKTENFIYFHTCLVICSLFNVRRFRFVARMLLILGGWGGMTTEDQIFKTGVKARLDYHPCWEKLAFIQQTTGYNKTPDI